MLPSTVSFKLSKLGAKSVKANAFNARSVSLALRPAWAKVEAIPTNSPDDTPKFFDNLVTSADNEDNSLADLPVIC